MFTLSSSDLNIPPKSDQEITKPIRIETSNEKSSKEKSIHNNTTASCDEDGQIFVYDCNPNPINEQSQGKSYFFLLEINKFLIFFSNNITKKN